ncbi:ATP-binding cassette sub- B member 6, mitochondrial [Linnemannia schmuckeri]|uniref:ATP-binding cassette sub- B member 6, mitochondrial n=1 Tax=Linnemannia schmuckeri TaxID=64567 RepID=A0A9P5RVB8_9FUNG|nr:ATP-binding cassette sub- B member 6, mitochondrial [Linnemannia schmuckeri]
MAPSAVFHIDKAPLEGSLPFLLFILAILRFSQLTSRLVYRRSSFHRADTTSTTATSTKGDLQDNSDDSDGNDDKKKKSLDDTVAGELRYSTFVDQVPLRFYQMVSATYLLDLAVIGYCLSQAHQRDSANLSVAFAKLAAWVAFTLNWMSLALDTKIPRSRTSHLRHHLLAWTALVGALVSVSPHIAHGSRTLLSDDLFRSNIRLNRRMLLPSVTEDVLERVMIGSFALRLCLLSAISIFSAIQLFGGLDINISPLPAPLLKDPSAKKARKVKLAAESADKKEQLKKHDTVEQYRANALKSVVPKVLMSIRMMYPVGNKRLQFLLFLRFALMVVERIIRILVPLQTERLLRAFSPEGNTNGSVALSKFDVGSVLLYVFYNYLQRHSSILSLLHSAAERPLNSFIRETLQLRFFEHAHSLSMQFHQDKQAHELIGIMQMGVQSVTEISSIILFTLLPTVCDVTVTLLYFSIIWGWKYGLLIISNAILITIVSKLHGKMMKRVYREMIQTGGARRSHPTDTLMNAETVKYFTNEAYEVGRYEESIENSRKSDPGLQFKFRSLSIIQTIIWTWNLLAGCLLCAHEISSGQRDPASFMTFVLYSQQLEGPIQTLSWVTNHLRDSLASLDEMMAVFKLEPTVNDIPDAPPLVMAGGEIEFENVSFQYSPDKRGLSNISFKVQKGQTVGIVGPTGGGKSTILRLLVRFWDPCAGRILIDGQDISKVAQLSVRENIGAVPQDPVLFYDTIGYNINYGRTTASKEELEEAAKVAQIHDTIMKFEKGYETTVGNRGAKLSGGERQRISIARTILKNPSIIVMDEATSALDSMTESDIQQALNKMTKNRTTIAVAHRLSTIMHADLILYIKDGKIIERGTHEELIQAAIDNGGQGEYYKMWRIQTGRFYGDSNSIVGDNEMETCAEDNEVRSKKE